MSSQVQQVLSRDGTVALRREAGQWLKERRESAGLSQRDLSAKIGFEYYTFISQIEAGRGRVPAERYEAYAQALGINPREFTKTMLRYNDTVVYNLLFGPEAELAQEPQDAAKPSLKELEKRLLLLESHLLRD
ncbi:helix-turn-helix domain-containing protein [Rhizobium rhizoryzae]|uniref:Transcriptional regulator with XRE-family HTH domain n=1 Tax=Rhizobium rhizoryzae TaxID=451876 RepID=A0A7W6PUE2_9HYPH|nr:helix-turn-helix transcriptional regulator [Rhizobium rhizoryzae]MBB4145755.1 transcriptional regulator with XRE-family HTH domain [Rhizobium rhizoryzae]